MSLMLFGCYKMDNKNNLEEFCNLPAIPCDISRLLGKLIFMVPSEKISLNNYEDQWRKLKILHGFPPTSEMVSSSKKLFIWVGYQLACRVHITSAQDKLNNLLQVKVHANCFSYAVPSLQEVVC